MEETDSANAYYKLISTDSGQNFVRYVSALSVTVGRQFSAGTGDHVALRPTKGLSRLHARITFNPESCKFEFQCLSKNGAFVNGQFLTHTSRPIVLASRALIQVSSHLLYFLLPGPKENGEQNVPVKSAPKDPFAALDANSPFTTAEDFLGSESSAPSSVVVHTLRPLKRWTKREREKFRNEFFTWGYPRWDKVLSGMGEARSERELDQYAMMLVSQLMYLAGSGDYTRSLAKLLRTASRKGIPSPQPDPTIANWPALQKHARKWASRIAQLFELNIAIVEHGEMGLMKGSPNVQGRPPGGWWGEQEDRDLLRGVYKHGYGNFDAIRDDKDLVFASRVFASKGKDDDKDKSAASVSPSIAPTVAPDSAAAMDTSQDAPDASQSKEASGGGDAPATGDAPAPPPPAPSADSSRPTNSKRPISWPTLISLTGRFKRVLDAIRVRDTRVAEKRLEESLEKQERDNLMTRSHHSSSKGESGDGDTMMMTRSMVQNDGGWSKRERAAFTKVLQSCGHPRSWETVKKFIRSLQGKSSEALEARYQSLVSVMNKLLSEKKNRSNQFDLTYVGAQRLKERLDMFDFLRLTVLPHSELQERLRLAEPAYELPIWWDTTEYDHCLIQGVLTYGLDQWELIHGSPSYPFRKHPSASIPDPPQVFLNRVKYLMSLFHPSVKIPKPEVVTPKTVGTTGATVGKTGMSTRSGAVTGATTGAGGSNTSVGTGGNSGAIAMDIDDPPTARKSSRAKRSSKLIQVAYDADNKVVLPVEINPSLTIVSLGVVEFERPQYHNNRHIFPIGFKSIREHPSMIDPTKRCKYYSEILDGGKNPIFRVTCEMIPEKPIDMASPSASWLVIDKEIDRLKTKKRKTVSVSGTERFGLAEATVIKLIRDLPNADKCSKYTRKDPAAPGGGSGVASASASGPGAAALAAVNASSTGASTLTSSPLTRPGAQQVLQSQPSNLRAAQAQAQLRARLQQQQQQHPQLQYAAAHQLPPYAAPFTAGRASPGGVPQGTTNPFYRTTPGMHPHHDPRYLQQARMAAVNAAGRGAQPATGGAPPPPAPPGLPPGSAHRVNMQYQAAAAAQYRSSPLAAKAQQAYAQFHTRTAGGTAAGTAAAAGRSQALPSPVPRVPPGTAAASAAGTAGRVPPAPRAVPIPRRVGVGAMPGATTLTSPAGVSVTRAPGAMGRLPPPPARAGAPATPGPPPPPSRGAPPPAPMDTSSS